MSEFLGIPGEPASSLRRLLGVVVTAGVLLALAIGTGLVLAVGGDGFIGLGLPDPGWLTRAGLPLVRVLSDCAAVITVGSLLSAAFLVPPRACGNLDVGGYAAVRTARIAALIWALAATLMVPLSASDTVGRPASDVLDPRLLAPLVFQLSQLEAWALTAGIALVLAGFSWNTRTWARRCGCSRSRFSG